MNIQTKLYTIQFFSPPDDQSAGGPQAEITDPSDFRKFHEIPGKGQTPRKVRAPRQERI